MTVETAPKPLEDWVALTKPRITLMALIVAWGSMMLAAGTLSYWKMICSLLGISLLVAGASVLNMYLERDVDALMERTKNRPLAARRLLPEQALSLGCILSLLSLPLLAFGANSLTVFLGVLSFVLYVFVYTPMKRVSAFALLVGSVPGAMPALMGYTAVTNQIDGIAWVVFGILFIWQLPHFIAITLYRGDEYKRAGFPVVGKAVGFAKARWLIILTTLFLVQLSILLWVLKVGSWLYLATSLALGIWFLKVTLDGAYRVNREKWSKKVFVASLSYECLLFLSLAIDVSLRYE